MPEVCSWLAALISPMMSVTRLTLATISSIVAPACSTSLLPTSTFSTESPISALISLAAAALRCARLRTSDATTAKPLPCSPARAASTAAFSARMLVWNAMPSITPMMSTIFFDDALIELMVSTTCDTTLPPFTATSEAETANWVAGRHGLGDQQCLGDGLHDAARQQPCDHRSGNDRESSQPDEPGPTRPVLRADAGSGPVDLLLLMAHHGADARVVAVERGQQLR